MEEAATAAGTLKTPQEYKAAIEDCLAEMRRLQEQIARDREEAYRLRDETRSALARLRAD